jgi:NAD(P)-dependent dehydrogenase (short-subunit alcohol dehydrogenase family)
MIVVSFPVRILCPLGAHHAGALRFVSAKKATVDRAFILDLRANGEDRSAEQGRATSAHQPSGGKLMTFKDKFRYDGKRALVVGGATGMGAATAELVQALGGEVVVMDYAPVTLAGAQAVKVNLADKASIDAALKEAAGRFDALFMCAGVAEGTPGIERINYVGHRYMVDRLMAEERVARGGAICFISSSAGLGWEANFPELSEVLDIADFDQAAEWMRAHGKDNYMGTKQAVCAYVAREALNFLKRGVRINAVCPGPTDTPLAQANFEQWLGAGADYRAEAGVPASSSVDQGYTCAFLCSEAAAAITGVTIVSDIGWFTGGLTGSFPAATPIAEFLTGRPAAYKKS